MTSSHQANTPYHDHQTESAPFLSTTDTYADLPAIELGRRDERSRSASPPTDIEVKQPHNHTTSPPSWIQVLLSRGQDKTFRWRRQNHNLSNVGASSPTSRKRRCCTGFLRTILAVLVFFGIVQSILMIGGFYILIHPDTNSDPPPAWQGPEHVVEGGQHWPTDFSADIVAVNCHSHNDYWRKEPLFTALKVGCVGVEADIWLKGNDLFVGHSKQSLTPARTFQSLYINPLLRILDRQNPITDFHPELDSPPNGVFDTNPEQTLVLLVDFKQDGDMLWPMFYSQLEPLRRKNYLTYFNGTTIVQSAITVVGTGGAPFEKILGLSQRDVFFDAPLASLGGKIDNFEADKFPVNSTSNRHFDPSIFMAENSFYASTSFRGTVGYPVFWKFTSAQMEKIRSHIAGAHARGLKARYWDIPPWPRSMRNYIWAVLVREGIDYLNADDVEGAARGEWGPPGKDGWWRPWETWS